MRKIHAALKNPLPQRSITHLLLQPEMSCKYLFSFADLSVKKCKARRCTICLVFLGCLENEDRRPRKRRPPLKSVGNGLKLLITTSRH